MVLVEAKHVPGPRVEVEGRGQWDLEVLFHATEWTSSWGTVCASGRGTWCPCIDLCSIKKYATIILNMLISPVCAGLLILPVNLFIPVVSLALAWPFPQGYSGLFQLRCLDPVVPGHLVSPTCALWLWPCWSYHSWLPQGKGRKRKGQWLYIYIHFFLESKRHMTCYYSVFPSLEFFMGVSLFSETWNDLF